MHNMYKFYKKTSKKFLPPKFLSILDLFIKLITLKFRVEKLFYKKHVFTSADNIVLYNHINYEFDKIIIASYCNGL